MGQQSATLVTSLRQAGIDVLGGLSDRLAQLRDLLAAVSGTFFALANVGAGQADGLDFKQIAELLLSICDQLDGWGSEAVNTDALEQLARSGYALRSLEQQVKQFRLIASLTAIRVAESGTDGMNDFVEEIRAVPEMIQGSVHKVPAAKRRRRPHRRRPRPRCGNRRPILPTQWRRWKPCVRRWPPRKPASATARPALPVRRMAKPAN